MRRLKKILLWTGIVLLVIITGLTLTVIFRQNLTYARPYPAVESSTDSAKILRGKYIVLGPGHCAECHSTTNPDSLLNLGQDVPMTGGFEFKLPVGSIYSKNITPDSATGIGKYTDAEIARALRYGVHPDGKVVYDFMPFHNVSDDDLSAIISYLRSQKPVYHKVPDHQLNVMGNIVKAFLVKPVGPDEPVPAYVKPDTTADYGKYVSVNLAGCKGCHTQRDLAGQFTGALFAGGNEIEGFITPNLTPGPGSRLNGVSQEQFIERFRKPKQIAKSPMPWNEFRRMSDDDLKAIYKYLQSLPAEASVLPK